MRSLKLKKKQKNNMHKMKYCNSSKMMREKRDKMFIIRYNQIKKGYKLIKARCRQIKNAVT